ncbi:MAG: hypothetical protein J7J76_05705, partial [Candidatus Latescibacteria bacterium]|nr:hypothetical protein [Candidatus Latescibacterota bacterium]
ILVENFNVSVDSGERFARGEGELPWLFDLPNDLSAPEKANDQIEENPWGLSPVMISLREHLVDYTA